MKYDRTIYVFLDESGSIHQNSHCKKHSPLLLHKGYIHDKNGSTSVYDNRHKSHSPSPRKLPVR